ncbi:hypothetical protein [Dehalobacterium formicoaceticum]|uniref:Uncharacterized protein n=1 Tax=Dehalobacterium formicoaceticum TaxID=51515 RepID=A0ABT1Y5E8_9FIRM|nr:hypothetical protein [Dehalobacterium formicoaceticum]MCR6546104.1 hypothetical protein [Dehalobacterium formicoaceticum]
MAKKSTKRDNISNSKMKSSLSSSSCQRQKESPLSLEQSFHEAQSSSSEQEKL